ncbi:MAG: hypothetical protein ACKVT2_01915 [Saprospiraceae bacterium]
MALIAQNVWQLMAARNFHEIKSGHEKTELIRDLEYKGWFQLDTFLGLDRKIEYHKTDLSPFVDDTGESVFLIAEVSPEFPGGGFSQHDYFQNLLSDLLSKPEEETQNTLYIKFSVQKNGKIVEVEPAQPFPNWVQAQTGERCLEAIRQMPDWSPGLYRNRAVKVKMLQTFQLRE